MIEQELIDWVVLHREDIEQAIVDATDEFLQKRRIGKEYSNVAYDLQQSQRESFHLSSGEDLCYDRFTTGAIYSLFYLGRRINTSLRFAAEFVKDAIERNRRLDVFDLGAGTGAVHIAIGLCVEAATKLYGKPLPALRVINVDISPVMLDFASSCLLKSFRARFPSGFYHVIPEYECVSWTNTKAISIRKPYIVASYMFDHSDNRSAVVKSFQKIVDQFAPEKVVLTTSYKKKNLVDEFVKKQEKTNQFKYKSIPFDWNLPLKGGMNILQEYRKNLNDKYATKLIGHHKVVWDEKSFYGVQFEEKHRQARLFESEAVATSINLYQPKIRIRRELVLSGTQTKAATPDGNPTIILGAAGSGKSVVITERIKNIVDQNNYSPDLSILLTTFNKSLVGYLIEWLKNLLDDTKYKFLGNSENGRFRFIDSPNDNIRVVNFDKLPTQFGKVLGDLETGKFGLRKRMEEAVRRVVTKRDLDREKYQKILDCDFLHMEYIRVVYGLLYLESAEYQQSERTGRGNTPRLLRNSTEREIIWECIKEFLIILSTGIPGYPAKDTIHTRRQKLYRKLKDGHHQKFTHVFVDEFQDCTLADYQLFYGLAEDNNEVILTGDYAQAVHLGASSNAPRAIEAFQENKPAMKRRTVHHLKGSYRLPFRITECLRPLSEHINSSRSDVDVNIINPYRGAPPGARPILVYASTTESMANKLMWIHYHYQIFNLEGFGEKGLHQITILERDEALAKAINGKVKFNLATTDTILRLKGMEKDCIVWSTQIGVNTPGDEYYFVYTILTRTRSILIIAMFDETVPTYREIVKLFPKDRLMVWDAETEFYYNTKVCGELAMA